jgi:subtilisin family serine protease
MKLKSLSYAVTVALYSATSAYAAVELAPKQHKLEALGVTAQQIKEFNAQFNDDQVGAKVNEGVNTQINTQATKFQPSNEAGTHTYLVRLLDQPVSVYATNPNSSLARSLKSGGKLYQAGKAQSREVIKYEQRLLAKQQEVAQALTAVVGGKQIRQQYTKAINGFSVMMTEQEAALVATQAGVAQVMRLKDYELLSDEGPKHIGADKIWSGEVTGTGVGYKGEGQIVGVIDTGINSDHPSFADLGGDGYDHTNPWGSGNYVGDCVDDAEHIQCNDKLIGVRSYPVITDAFKEMRAGWPSIGEDYQGHGSHVASTAAGNVLTDVPFMLPSSGENADGTVVKDALFGQMSGVAPHANIIAYQVCHADNDQGFRGCPGEALLAGIEDAIADGVDVINFSIGGADSDVWADAVQLAFLSAREAGINVAAAAGNSGTMSCGYTECFGMLDNSSPWLAQVAATTHGREVAIETAVEYAGFVDPSFGSEMPSWAETGLVGGAMNQEPITGVVVWAKDYVDVTGNKDYNGYCVNAFPADTFNYFKDGSEIPGAASGDTKVIVVCQRHDPADPNANARTAKIDNIKAGGADGFIMFNRAKDQGTPLTQYDLPGVHFTYDQWNGPYYGYNHPDNADGLEDWVDSTSEKGHMITIKPTVIERRVNPENADWLANFSSRGPSFYNREVLAPAIAAPGVDIYAAYSDEKPFTSTPAGADFSMLSGTSMASPHIAGTMALLRQAKPEWSAAEVQSALLMTADNVVKTHRANTVSGEVGDAKIYRAGSGRVNVANAIQSGLVMDESAENFLAANPNNGGSPNKLNLPNLMDFSCKPTCEWVRTVKATKDGSWKLSHSDVVNWAYDLREQQKQNGVNIEFIPNEFSLKAGETQTVLVRASIVRTSDPFSDGQVELHSNVILESTDGQSPDLNWPLVMKYERHDLPRNLTVTAHADKDIHTVNGITIPEAPMPSASVLAPVKAEYLEYELPRDDERTFPWRSGGQLDGHNPDDVIDEATRTFWFDIPENTARFILQSEGNIASDLAAMIKGNQLIFLGQDLNGNGQPDMQDEILCVSNAAWELNYCNIVEPKAGSYWAVAYSSGGDANSGVLETHAMSWAIVPNTVASDVTAHLPESDGSTPVDLTLSWDSVLEQDAIYYSMISLGTSSNNPQNIGQIPLRIERGEDRVSMAVTQDKAKAGDMIPVTFSVMANNSGSDRDFTISATLPEGLRFNPSDVLVSSNAIVENVAVNGQEVVLSGVQTDTTDVTPHYAMSTNITDDSCKTPNFGNSNPGGYVNLKEFGIPYLLDGFDESNNVTYRRGTMIPVSAMFNGRYSTFHLYNHSEKANMQNNMLNIHGNGWIDLFGGGTLLPAYFPMGFLGQPFEVIAPFWRVEGDGQRGTVLSTKLGWDSGIALASTASGWGIVSYGNAKDYVATGYDRATRTYSWDALDSNFDFQVMFNVNTSFVDGDYELIMAYNDIDFADTNSNGSIGTTGYKGNLTPYGPLSPVYGDQFAFQNLAETIKDDLVVCYDYVGPESSQFEVTIWTTVRDVAAGETLSINATADVAGMDSFNLVHDVMVNSNIQLGKLSAVTTDEETPVSVAVIYSDDKNTANTISASGEGVSIEVTGHTAGSELIITPNENFFGETTITVTVADMDNPSDKASQQFTLTVNGKDDAPTAKVQSASIVATQGQSVMLDASASFDVDGDTLSYTWQGPGNIVDPTAAATEVTGLSAGTHEFLVTVSDGSSSETALVTVTVAALESDTSDSSSSGSMPFGLSLLLLGMTMLRRKKR